MKILVTGAGGFIGRNLVSTLSAIGGHEILECHADTPANQLNVFCGNCDFVFHLAGVNRPDSDDEFTTGNVNFTAALITALEANGNACPVVFTSSIQADLDNPYGLSKRAAEEILRRRGNALIYRLPNVFGKWCRPNYNSAVATFCYNVARGLEIHVNDQAREMHLVYIDDLVKEFLLALEGKEHHDGNFCCVPTTYRRNLNEIAELIQSFPRCRASLSIPDQTDEFVRKLYSTYLSFLPADNFGYDLLVHKDTRGSFAEFVRTPGQGQFSVNIIKPHVVKGNHWHHSKHEKFLVVSGEGVIRFRNIFSSEIIEYAVSGAEQRVIEIPPGYTHNIENVGDTDMAVVMWANENFDPQNPDTYFLAVNPNE